MNYGNPVLAQRNPDTGEAEGVTAAIGRDLGARLSLPVSFVGYETAGAVFEAAKRGEWDLCFLAIDPVRAEEICFSDPYVIIRGGYIVKAESDFKTNTDIDQPGVSVAVGKNAAYDLFLTRSLANARIVRAESSPAAVDLFVAAGLDAAAGVSISLRRFAEENPGVRVLDEHFMVIYQATGVPIHRCELISIISPYIEMLKKSGFIQKELNRSQQFEAEVTPLQA